MLSPATELRGTQGGFPFSEVMGEGSQGEWFAMVGQGGEEGDEGFDYDIK